MRKINFYLFVFFIITYGTLAAETETLLAPPENKIDFLGGILENKFINATQVADLAKLPSKQELYAKIVGSINAPVSGFVNALAGNLKNLVYALSAIKDKKQI